MSKPRFLFAGLLGLVLLGQAAIAAESGYKDYVKSGTFDDVSENLKDAIVNRGYVIDYVGQFNKMLERTAADTGTITAGGNKSPYKNAQYMQFCPSKLTHEAVNASPFAIANCPIALFVYETNYEPGKVHVGYRLPVASPSKRVNEVNEKLTAVLHEIATAATK
jgi:hypothetical protein